MMDNCAPRCPWCGTAKSVSASGTNPHAFYCGRCSREFEDIDDGDVGYGRPEKRLERKEKLSAQERQRRISEGMRLAWRRKHGRTD